MAVRERNQMAVAVVELEDAAQRLHGDSPRRKAPVPSAEEIEQALALISGVLARLREESGGALGVPVSAAAEYLGVSEQTVRSWVARGVLEDVAGSKTKQVEAASLRRIGAAISELRARGQERDWLRTLVDLLHDRALVRSEGISRGLDEMNRGKLEPA